ncbi:MarR family winged helix-turn-helix transcriptional regulator [Fodinicola feengrottensis]|uniref:MarR family winged helix-turn-helix transcriptional regulator n=1 Tax=Fodinicola feengrottensis TaxID=435914 RepID=UPI0013D624EF|nr:MarR family transcriptional regulator [Fodinicola feengrottensis]
MEDAVDHILQQWHRERPDLDVSPIGVIGRLSRAADAVEARLEDTYALHGLDGSSYDVLATLRRAGHPYELSPAELSRTAMISSSAVAQRVNKLVTRGWVKRGKSATDGRGTLVRLTAAGLARIEAALPAHLANEHTIVSALTKAEQAR